MCNDSDLQRIRSHTYVTGDHLFSLVFFHSPGGGLLQLGENAAQKSWATTRLRSRQRPLSSNSVK